MNRILIVLAICCGTVGFSTALTFAESSGSAAIVTGTPVGDPLVDPAASVGIVEKLWRSGAITSSLIVAAFMVLVVLRSRVAWFSQGWRTVWCSALIGGLSMLVQAIQSGLTPNASMIIVAATTTAALALQPKPKPPEQLPSGEVRP